MWQLQLINEIRIIDREQAPHGLYGLRDALSTGPHLISRAAVFSGSIPATNLPGRLGWTDCRPHRYCDSNDSISFRLPSLERVHLSIIDFASTKVRHYGNSFTLDKVHGKKTIEDHERLRSIVPKLNRPTTRFAEWQAILCIAHVPAPQRLEALYGKTSDEVFLHRYNLELHTETWPDVYDRRFHTGIALWSNHQADFS